MTRILVSGGLFNESYGILSVVSLVDGEMTIDSEHVIQHPDSEIAVMGKGITGTCIDGNYLWACFSNVIVKIDLTDYSICDTIENREFNDLHDIIIHNGRLYVANTGNETVDIIDVETKEIERIDLLGESMRKLRPKYSQNQDTKPHLHHISSVAIDSEDSLIIGLVRQQRILNLSKWEWLGSKYESPVHDVQFVDGELWFTTVGGSIQNERTEWSLADYQSELGWTRGLGVTGDGIFVGTTAIRESNHDYYKIITNSDTVRTGAKIFWIPFDNQSKTIELNLPNSESRKVFSIEFLSK